MTDITGIGAEIAASHRALPEKILQVENLGVEFWVEGEFYPAAIDMNYTVRRGEVLAIVGESGSGKSTSSMALLGLLPENARVTGSIKLLDRELRGVDDSTLRALRGNEIAVIFQEPMTALNPVYTIGFQIVEALRSHNASLAPYEAKARAIELLGLVEMPNPVQSFDKYPHQLSGGQRQRAMIAQSISCDPLLLIADEPTTALDVTVQAEILDLLRNLHKRLDSAIILITHDMGVVADLADRILVMKSGEVVESGTVDEIFHAPQHPYTQQLLAAVPHLGLGVLEEADVSVAELIVEDPAVPVIAQIRERASEAAEDVDARPPVLLFEDVAIDYPKRGRIPAFRAAEHINLEIHAGEILGLVGESGSGKTTLGRAAIGLLPIAEGKLTAVGTDISNASQKDLRAIRRRTGIVFQDPASSLNPRMPIGQSIGEPLLLAGEAKGKELDRRVETLLDQVELPRSYRNRFPHELSGGQRQRVGIARALALAPELLVADEPTSALDVSVQARFLELLQEIQGRLQFACLFISHDLAVVDILAHRIAVMHLGKLVETGTRDQILRGASDPYTQRLIAAVPVPDPEEQRIRREARALLLDAESRAG
ncbi:ABC transporter ATP-binding protein [Microbacterium sp. zg.B48]|uniref:dipeptide ABC transporter ATP-binding protein n=1 Tax=unclassified Microbacterium TaxID=2609290 RepID=UPI00214B722B|nr:MULTISPECIES: ABC transporter ATP-binding protein [unclassified Microbacterium]MCR2762236.1 ABC transporter ATP-binding protein [Microbacterium sp. zg.B48]MCR2809757.1 ABC transporter ATP-binding protein [Microbacterium sp. zg.B185]WIM17931.1 ABC transporter ATP-binding protein [Microbacterium sp. zg-B185]